MSKSRVHKLIFGAAAMALVLSPVGLVFLPGAAESTQGMMPALPAYSKFQCQNCHTLSNPVVGNAALNAFGDDFKANGMVWDEVLADKNSDGDRCSNGMELGDRDGDGEYDYAGEPQESSNPGVADCTLPVDERTWGSIKDLFGNEIENLREYYDEVSWSYDFKDYERGLPKRHEAYVAWIEDYRPYSLDLTY